MGQVLAEIAPDAPERVLAMIRGTSTSPLQGLVSGSLDLDKIEYLKRDTLMCGVPYGTIDADRLINSLTVVADPQTGALRIGVLEKGLSALESLLFAKYQMIATCTGTTPCAARRRCTSAWSTKRWPPPRSTCASWRA
ncbi:MAG: hypothetical protein IPK33_00645 [Gemmatimonadetes bacterium]|nr:hypothetical protein [Gemmatimonadota bacterium]